MGPRQHIALLVLFAAPAVGLNMLDGVKKLLLKRDSAFLYQEKALFMPGANARTEATAKTACASGDRAAILRAVDDLEAVCVADDFLDNEAERLDGRWTLLATVAGLGVAIPALFGYNYLAAQIKNATSDMQIFIDEFITRVAELYGSH